MKNIKKPFGYAFAAAAYIAFIVNLIDLFTTYFPGNQTKILIPMTMLSLFVLSAAVMGFLFLSEPFYMYMDGKKNEAVAFFGKTVGFFAIFALIYSILLFVI